MVWGGFSALHRTPPYHVQENLTAQTYRDKILCHLLFPYFASLDPRQC